MRIRPRTWVSIATLVLIMLLLFAARQEIIQAWKLMGQVNLWVLTLFIPLALLNYYSSGETVLSYLRQKGKLRDITFIEQMRMALEFNFVNHALPSGGASGVSYMTWRLIKLGVSPAKAGTAQAVRFVMGFAAFFVLLLIAVLMITVDGEINRLIILVSSGLVTLLLGGMILVIYAIKDKNRLSGIARFITRAINTITRKITRGKKRVLVREEGVESTMEEMNEDYADLKRDQRLLVRPFWWSIIFIMTDVMMFFVAFWALGTIVNPAPILLAYGLATIAGFIVVTPGGSGAYEALMVSFLAVAGVTGSVAIAGVLLTRVIVLLIILGLGYLSYQHAIIKYGKPKTSS